MQTRLLRVLEDGKFMRVGGREEIASDLRVVAATNRELERDVRTGRFRQDLYFRLSTFIIRLPPLRERPSEIELFAELFARQFGAADEAAPASARRRRDGRAQGARLAGERARAAQRHRARRRAGRRRRRHRAAPPRQRARGAPGAPATSGGMRGQVAETERRAIEDALAGRGRQSDPGRAPPGHLPARAALQARQVRLKR